MAPMLGKTIIVLGIVLVVIGLVLVLAPRLPFLGRLPGDFLFRRDGATFFFPLATSLILSIILTVLLNIAFRVFR